MSRKKFGTTAAVLVCAGALGSGAMAEEVVESTESEASVIVTKSLESFGIGTQDAHEIALLATAGVILQEQPDTCIVYMVTMHWCETVNGCVVPKRLRIRLDADCLGGGAADIPECLDVECPPGTRPMLLIPTGPGGCAPIPEAACIYFEISGPVETVCDLNFSCDCLPFLDDLDCTDQVSCVPVDSSPGGAGSVPIECPECD